MVGDGGNDCCALRAADVGLALCEGDAEASLVAPFNTARSSLMSVVDLLKMGRCVLVTNLATVTYFLFYGISSTSSSSWMFLMGDFFWAEWLYVFREIWITAILVWAMSMCRPATVLANCIPESRIFSKVHGAYTLKEPP